GDRAPRPPRSAALPLGRGRRTSSRGLPRAWDRDYGALPLVLSVHGQEPAPQGLAAEPGRGERDGEDEHPESAPGLLHHSYPIASRTGRRAACHAGRPLASPASSTDAASQTRIAFPSKAKSGPVLKTRRTRRSPSAFVSGNATATAIAQLETPRTIPSTITRRRTAAGEAPIARRTPISRRRSRTFRLIVVARPRPPTPARTSE